MRTQHDIRRWLLGSLVVVAVAFAALGGPGASAEIKTTRPRPDFASREEFRLECAILGGSFTDDGRKIRCTHRDGTVIECDLNGQQCTITNRGHRPGGGANSPAGTGEQHEGEGGGRGVSGLPGEPAPKSLPKRPGANG